MATLREFNGIQEVQFKGEFDVIFGEAIYQIVDKDLCITGIITELFGDDLFDKDNKKIDLPTTPVLVKVPTESYTKEGKRKDGTDYKFDVKCTPGIEFGIRLLKEQIEPGQPFKGQLSFKLPQPLINSYETGLNARNQPVTREVVLSQISQFYWVEKIEALSFKMPEASKRSGSGYAPKETEKDRLQARFQFLTVMMPNGNPPITNLYELYYGMLGSGIGEHEGLPTFKDLLDLLMG